MSTYLHNSQQFHGSEKEWHLYTFAAVALFSLCHSFYLHRKSITIVRGVCDLAALAVLCESLVFLAAKSASPEVAIILNNVVADGGFGLTAGLCEGAAFSTRGGWMRTRWG